MFQKVKRWLFGLFAPEVKVGRNIHPPMNRKQRRATAAIVRKQLSKQKGDKQ